jgi:threonine synthase
MKIFYEKKKNKINIITATSGDTGAAAINAIQKRKNINIFVLHPLNKISQTQRKLMTCIHSKNVFNIAVQGNFDDCQNLVKGMFNDYDFRMLINMTGVNSINWSRIFSQVVYFFYAHFKLSKNILSKSVFSVPTGNFGDIYAGYIAKKMGLPISNLIIATNENNILDRFLKTGIYKPTKVIQSISPSMDIQVASNFERLIFDYLGKNSQETKKLMEHLRQKGFYKFSKSNLKKIKRTFYSNSVRSDEAKKEIKNIYSKYGKVIDPHTITAIKSINKLKKHFDKYTNYICLETAHPAKFRENISKIIKTKVELPKKIRRLIKKKERYCILPNSLEKIKKYILSKSLQLHF